MSRLSELLISAIFGNTPNEFSKKTSGVASNAYPLTNAHNNPEPPPEGADRIAADGYDSIGAYHVAANGFNHIGANNITANGLDHISADRIVADRADHLGVEGLAETPLHPSRCPFL